MRWFTAAVAFQTGMEDGMEVSVSLVPLRSSSPDEARSRAEVLGSSLAAAYEWEFDALIDLYEITDDELEEGVELYSFFIDRPLLAAVREQASRGIGGARPTR